MVNRVSMPLQLCLTITSDILGMMITPFCTSITGNAALCCRCGVTRLTNLGCEYEGEKVGY